MQYTNLVRASYDDVTTVKAMFHDPHTRQYKGKAYTYFVPLKWKVVAEDFLVVPVASTVSATPTDGYPCMKVVQVYSVDNEAIVDLDATFPYHWAVAKFDHTWYQRQCARDEMVVEQVQAKRQAIARRQLLESLLGGSAETFSLEHKLEK